MAFLTGKIKLDLYTDSAQTAFPKELLPSIEKEFESSSISSAQVLTISIAASGNQTVNLNGVGSVTRIYMISTQDLNANFNSLGNIGWKASVPGFAPLSVSSLVLTNTSSTTAATVSLVLIED